MISTQQLRQVIDHTYLKTQEHGDDQDQQRTKIETLVFEALKFGAFSVCIRPEWVKFARDLIRSQGSSLKICTVIGFPFPQNETLDTKKRNFESAVHEGADEFDVVFHYAAYFEGKHEQAREELALFDQLAGPKVLKVILETSALPTVQIGAISQFVVESLRGSPGPRFLKTSTGFGPFRPDGSNGATLEDVAEMSKFTGEDFGLKPSGGIMSFEDGVKFLEASGIMLEDGVLNPLKFRIGSSSLLVKLK